MRTLDARLKRLETRGRGPGVLIVAEIGETHEQAVARYLAQHPGATGPFTTVQTGVPRGPSSVVGAR